MNIEGVEEFVGPTTEDKFTDEFWEGLDLCWNQCIIMIGP